MARRATKPPEPAWDGVDRRVWDGVDRRHEPYCNSPPPIQLSPTNWIAIIALTSTLLIGFATAWISLKEELTAIKVSATYDKKAEETSAGECQDKFSQLEEELHQHDQARGQELKELTKSIELLDTTVQQLMNAVSRLQEKSQMRRSRFI